jgi:ubiquinone/menaquinone biosynthesis C-methylase UbiE
MSEPILPDGTSAATPSTNLQGEVQPSRIGYAPDTSTGKAWHNPTWDVLSEGAYLKLPAEKKVVIGESMDRVGPAARALGARHYCPRPGRTSEQMDAGARRFVYRAVKAGKLIFTIGPDPRRPNYPKISSPSYQGEVTQILRMKGNVIGCDIDGSINHERAACFYGRSAAPASRGARGGVDQLELVHTESIMPSTMGVAYDLVSQDGLYRELNERLVEVAELDGPLRIIDLGCGTGSISEILLRSAKVPRHIWAIDPDPEMVTRCRQRLGGSVGVSQARAEDFSSLMPSGSVEAVFLGNSIHLVSDLDSALAGISRVLGPGGLLAFNTAFFDQAADPSEGALAREVVFEARKQARARNPGVEFAVGVRPPAKRRLNEELYRQLLEAAGFADIQFSRQTYALPPELVFKIISTPVFATGALPGLPEDEAIAAVRAACEAILLRSRDRERPPIRRTWLYARARKS